MAKKIKNKKNKSVIKKNLAQVIMLSLIIFLVIFLIYKILDLAVGSTESFIVEKGEISQEESQIGYIIRKEQVIEPQEEQLKIVQIKNEGERVAVGETVFRYEAAGEEELKQKITEINAKIQEAMEGQTEIFSSDIKALEKQIETKIRQMQNKNNLQEIKEYKTDIESYIVKKAKISGELSPSGSYMNNLIDERTNLEDELKNNSKYEISTIGGVVSYRVDGLEETLSPENFADITIQSLENLNLTTGQIVTTSEKSGKVIDNFECYIAVATDTEDARKANIGDKIKVRLSGNEKIPAEIAHIKEEDGKRLIIIKINQGVEYLINYRKISLDIIWWEEIGLRVPNTSITYENGLAYIIRTKAGLLHKILVKIENENDNNCIITNYTTEELKDMGYTAQEIRNMRKISIFDEILANPDLEKVR